MPIEPHFTTEFSTNWIHRAQQTKARLDGFVEEEDFSGERKRWDRLHKQNSTKRTERIEPTNAQEVGSDSVWGYRQSFKLPNILDKDDAKNLGVLVLPTSDYVKSHAAAYHRDCDDVVIQAALGSVMTGEAGATPEVLPAGQKIAAGATGLTLAKLLTANEILEGADLEDDAMRVLVVAPQQLTNLLNTTEIKSADYNSIKALVNGQIDTFMGFKFIKNTRLTKVSTTRTCVAWVKGAVKRFKGEMASDISIRTDLTNATQILSTWHLGAARVYYEGVVQIDCTEA
jgi:hypothetical protein